MPNVDWLPTFCLGPERNGCLAGRFERQLPKWYGLEFLIATRGFELGLECRYRLHLALLHNHAYFLTTILNGQLSCYVKRAGLIDLDLPFHIVTRFEPEPNIGLVILGFRLQAAVQHSIHSIQLVAAVCVHTGQGIRHLDVTRVDNLDHGCVRVRSLSPERDLCRTFSRCGRDHPVGLSQQRR